MKDIPKWLLGYIDHAGREKISRAVQSAEMHTSGEIVPMIVRQSVTSGHTSQAWVREIILMTLAVIYLLTHFGYETYAWVAGAVGLVVAIVELIGGFSQRSLRLLRRFTPAEDVQLQVRQRAVVEFYESGLHYTMGKTGILIYVSLFEHQAVVLVDKAIADKLPADTWNQVVELLLQEIKQGRMVHGFESAVQECGRILAQHFPRETSDQNELLDKLMIKE